MPVTAEKPASVAALARAAANEIRRRGWTQGDYGDNPDSPGSCRVCLFGAVNAAAYGDPYHPAFTGVGRSLNGKLAKTLAVAPDEWNDTPGRTQDEVIALLERVADEAEANG